MSALPPTPGQTVGPFFGNALPWDGGPDLVPASHPEAIRLRGTVYDGQGDPVPDALLEIWQAAPDGSTPQVEGSLHRDGRTFTGFGRAETDADGRYSFTTVRPGAPFVAMTVFARGLLDRLATRVYFSPDDPFLRSVPGERRSTLVASDGDDGWVFDIHLQGERETVFLRYDA